MNVTAEFLNCLIDFEKKLAQDEWYFVKFRDRLRAKLDSSSAFSELNKFIDFIISSTYSDENIVIEMLEIALSLMNISNTTEIPKSLQSNKAKLEEKTQNYGNYCKSKVDDIFNWYRIKKT